MIEKEVLLDLYPGIRARLYRELGYKGFGNISIFWNEEALKKLNDLPEGTEKDEAVAKFVQEVISVIEDADKVYVEAIHDRPEDNLKRLVQSLFNDFLDYTEVSDSDREFHPIHFSCSRAHMIPKFSKLLSELKEEAFREP